MLISATTGFMLSLSDNHQAEKQRFWRNQKKVLALYLSLYCDDFN